MIEAIFLGCALTSLACAGLLFRGYLRSRVRLLMWSSFCFAGMALHNLLRLVQVLMDQPQGAAWMAMLPALVGVLFLLFGFIFDVE